MENAHIHFIFLRMLLHFLHPDRGWISFCVMLWPSLAQVFFSSKVKSTQKKNLCISSLYPMLSLYDKSATYSQKLKNQQGHLSFFAKPAYCQLTGWISGWCGTAPDVCVICIIHPHLLYKRICLQVAGHLYEKGHGAERSKSSVPLCVDTCFHSDRSVKVD